MNELHLANAKWLVMSTAASGFGNMTHKLAAVELHSDIDLLYFAMGKVTLHDQTRALADRIRNTNTVNQKGIAEDLTTLRVAIDEELTRLVASKLTS